MRQEFWDKRAETLREYAGSGMSISQVAEKLGINRVTIIRYSKLYEIDFVTARNTEEMDRRIQAITEAAASGKTREEAAKDIGISTMVVGNIARANGIQFVHGSAFRSDGKRAEVMASMYRGGKTLNEIGAVYGITRERVRQIIKKWHGITGMDGGKHVSAARKQSVRKSAKDRRAMEVYGCTYAEYRGLVAIGMEMRAAGVGRYRTPTFAWHSQRSNAKTRGVEWNISLWDWWDIWQKSGKWDERGRGVDKYVMCRFGDSGAYEVGNVYIATCSHNCSVQPNNPYRKSHPGFDEASVRLRQRRLGPPVAKANGLPVGVTAIRGGRYQAQMSIDGKNTYLGTFRTPEEAHSAYLNKLSELALRAAA